MICELIVLLAFDEKSQRRLQLTKASSGCNEVASLCTLNRIR